MFCFSFRHCGILGRLFTGSPNSKPLECAFWCLCLYMTVNLCLNVSTQEVTCNAYRRTPYVVLIFSRGVLFRAVSMQFNAVFSMLCNKLNVA